MTRIARFGTLAIVVALSTPGQPLVAQERGNPLLAVMPFQNAVLAKDRAELDGLGTGISDVLVTELSANQTVRVLERERMLQSVRAQSAAAGGVVDQSTAVSVGRLLGAQYVIIGSFMSDGVGNLRIDTRAVNVATGQVAHTDRLQGKGDDIMPMLGQLAARVDAGLRLSGAAGRAMPASGRRLGGAVAGGAAAAAMLPLKHFAMYGRALDMADRGDHARAAALFGAVLADFPDFAPARAGLSRLRPRS